MQTENKTETFVVTEKQVNGMPKFGYCAIDEVKKNEKIIETHDNFSSAALGSFRCYMAYCHSLELPKVYAVYLDNSSSLGMNYAFGNVIYLHEAQNDEFFKTRKIIFISENWETCNELCVKIGDLEQARFNRINGI